MIDANFAQVFAGSVLALETINANRPKRNGVVTVATAFAMSLALLEPVEAQKVVDKVPAWVRPAAQFFVGHPEK